MISHAAPVFLSYLRDSRYFAKVLPPTNGLDVGPRLLVESTAAGPLGNGRRVTRPRMVEELIPEEKTSVHMAPTWGRRMPSVAAGLCAGRPIPSARELPPRTLA
jgi:hypothetical protein